MTWQIEASLQSEKIRPNIFLAVSIILKTARLPFAPGGHSRLRWSSISSIRNVAALSGNFLTSPRYKGGKAKRESLDMVILDFNIAAMMHAVLQKQKFLFSVV